MAKKRALSPSAGYDTDAVVKLNVGGKRFETRRRTLDAFGFLRSMLSGNFEEPRDADGSVFLDRDGSLFEALLQSARTFTRPPQKLIDARRLDLIEECRFLCACLSRVSLLQDQDASGSVPL